MEVGSRCAFQNADHTRITCDLKRNLPREAAQFIRESQASGTSSTDRPTSQKAVQPQLPQVALRHDSAQEGRNSSPIANPPEES
jgi:hypothetical protein